MSPFGSGGPWDPGSSWGPMSMSPWGPICQKKDQIYFLLSYLHAIQPDLILYINQMYSVSLKPVYKGRP